jgi:restriction system protein
LEEQFVTEGGYSELLAAERLKERLKQKNSDPVPDCPKCGKSMVLQTTKTGNNAGHPFRGCSAYPDCGS